MADRCVQVDFSLLGQMEDCQTGEGFGNGCQPKDGILVDRKLLFPVAEPVKQFLHRLPLIYDGDSHATGIVGTHNLFDICFK